jgi:DNA excision repair protein ERCC-5
MLDENTVYDEDLDLDRAPLIPRKTDKAKHETPPSSGKKRSKWTDHDPYKLPDVDMDSVIAVATSTVDDDGVAKGSDPRLATEEELRQFIETMRPEDFDDNSPAFRELPTELQYEIIGDLRLKSRQTSYARLQQMLSTSKTAMDFSKAQIRGLYNRNHLTQQLLNTVDNMGKTVVDHHVRIVAERSKEYVLVKNEGPTGGWTLAFKDQGTKEKPIQVEPDSDDDDDMEEVLSAEEVPIQPVYVEKSSLGVTLTPRRSEALPDMLDFQRSMALSTIGNRHVDLPPLPEVPKKEPEPLEPLFNELYEIDSDHLDDDIPLSLALKASIDQQRQDEEETLRRALDASRVPEDPFQSHGAGPSKLRSSLVGKLSMAGATSLEQVPNDECFVSNVNCDEIDDTYAKGSSPLDASESDPKPGLLLAPQLDHVPEESRFELNTSILPSGPLVNQSDTTKTTAQAKLAHTTVAVAPSFSHNASTSVHTLNLPHFLC